MNDSVLVTGAAGFIGSHLSELLVRSGFNVRAMTHYNFQNNWGWLESLDPEILNDIEVIPADVSDPFAVDKAVKGVHTVFHLASLIAIPYSYQAPASYVETNIKGSLNVLQAALRNGVQRVVHTSTSETYGTARYTPIDENHPLSGQSPYSATKIGADKLAESYYLSFEVPVCIVRPFNTYGPRQSARAVIPTVISQALSGVDTIRLGSLEPVRDLTYVTDTVAGFLAVARSPHAIGQVTNIGYGEGIRIGDLAQLILELCNSTASIVSEDLRIRPANSEVMNLICDNTKARQNLDWRPRFSLREGLSETINWFTKNLDYYKSYMYNV